MTTQQIPKNIYDLLRREYGTEFIPSFSDALIATVGATSAQLLRQDGSRIGFVFVNLSANTIFIRPREAATTSAGIRVDSGGGSIVTIWKDDGPLPALDWHAIASGAASAFFFMALRLPTRQGV